MGLLFETFYWDILSFTVTLLCVLIAYFKYAFTYWTRRKSPQIQPQFPFGNTKDVLLLKRSFGECLKTFYTEFKSKGHRFGGFYMLTEPRLLIIDPDLVKTILTQDFSYFSDRGFTIDEEKEPLTGHLVSLTEHKWKSLRKKLTPTFSSGKMKMMFQTMLACADGLEEVIDNYVKNNKDIDIKEVLGRFTTDIIGSCAFGLDCNSFQSEDSEFRKYGLKSLTPTPMDTYKRSIGQVFPKLFYFLQLRLIDEDVTDFFFNVVANTIDYRAKNNIIRKDFLQLLINIKNTGNVDANLKDTMNGSIKEEKNGIVNGQGLTLEEITAQCYIFFLAGFETSSTAMSLFLYDMSLHLDIQDKVRKEVNDMLKRHDGKITYEGIMELQYLEQALFETMRLHSAIPFLMRHCTKDYKIPDSDVIIEKGTKVSIPINGIQSDPEYYPDPTKYDPERFTKEEQAKRHPFTFLPFGEGPRSCIGQRFGLLQSKVGLVVLLRNHKFSLNKKTQVPLKIDPKSTILSTICHIWVNATRI